MQNNPLPTPLQQFVDNVTMLLNTENDESVLHPKVGAAMKALVATDNWLDPAYSQPHPQYYQQYLLYADPQDRFSVVSFVWGPGQQTPIHDHTVWGVIGMLRGAEMCQSYVIGASGMPNPTGSEYVLSPGAVECVSPAIGDIHKVRNALNDQVSISIHTYGANIGKVKRHVFPPEGGAAKEFISGYSNTETT